MAAKFALVAGIAVAEAIVLVWVGTTAISQQIELSHLKSVMEITEQDRHEATEKLLVSTAQVEALNIQLKSAQDALRDSIQEIVSRPLTGPPQQTKNVPPAGQISTAQAAANRRAQWALSHAAEISKAKGSPHAATGDAPSSAEDNAERLAKDYATNLVKTSAYEYFRHHWDPGKGLILITDCDVTIQNIERKVGWDDEWNASGGAAIKYYLSSGGAVSTALHFTADVKMKTQECAINDVN